MIEKQNERDTIAALVTTHGDSQRFRIERGVAQAGALWSAQDGSPDDFRAFCESHFIADSKELDETFTRLDKIFESLWGHFNSMERDLREKMDLDQGTLRPLDMMMAQFSPSAHLTDDLFGNKIAFVILLNFPRFTLEEKRQKGANWSAKEWAMARIGDLFQSRVPAELQQEVSKVLADAEAYISEYNICLGAVRDDSGKHLFPDDLTLISHWGIRDELKSQYNRPDGFSRQEIIFQIMKRIITQEIPQAVINNPAITWNPIKNSVIKDVRAEATAPEPDTRYQHLLHYFRTMRKIDPYYPSFPTYIRRKFELEREMAEKEVGEIFTRFLSSPQLTGVARLIEQRLKRKLRPYDIWYDGFKSRAGIPEEQLTQEVTVKYPTIEAYQNKLPQILRQLGFTEKQTTHIAPKIVVDPARGAGHAAGALMKSDKAHLRTRVPQSGMDYKGYNIAMHELGHTVEQTLTLHNVPHFMNHGVPFTGFSEAFAFLFQNRDLELLGIPNTDPNIGHLRALDIFWQAAEIMGVALVDIKVWNWMYSYPDATAAQLKEAVITASKEVWNTFYAPAFGLRDEIILGIYSHMISYPLYLAEYPLGYLILFQIEQAIAGKNLGAEMERLCVIGNVVPQLWMKRGVGAEISGDALCHAADEALAVFN